jgi:hypothetical protein
MPFAGNPGGPSFSSDRDRGSRRYEQPGGELGGRPKFADVEVGANEGLQGQLQCVSLIVDMTQHETKQPLPMAIHPDIQCLVFAKQERLNQG